MCCNCLSSTSTRRRFDACLTLLSQVELIDFVQVRAPFRQRDDANRCPLCLTVDSNCRLFDCSVSRGVMQPGHGAKQMAGECSDGWHRIAWGYLKLVSDANGAISPP